MTIFGSINTAVEALNAFSVKIGNISDNVANASTTGYKTVDTQFSDLVATRFQGSPVLNATRQGGVTAASTFANRSPGQIVPDDSGSSAAVSGNGFFPVAKATGLDPVTGEPTGFETTTYYTRQGDFHLDDGGHLVNSAGYYLMTGTVSGGGSPQVFTINTADPALAAGLSDVSINDGGMVVANLSDHSTVKLGQILLANFPEPDGLDRVDGIAFRETAKSGGVVYGSAADAGNSAGVGTVKGSALELSTADTTDQMTQLIQTQQAYSMNSQIITISNAMLQTAVNLKT
ncbi:flagellar hook basal-body protein [Ferrovibrio xuzhouensis]|uniref:Flagellar hook protein FlgE n=1 Tax=Ferrovibrio xuzhouensis TaxID=1576914 RepID=A0ABV7VJM0_9PROT